MKFYKYLYTGESVEKAKRRIIRKIKFHKVLAGVYVVTLPMYGKELLEIYHANILLQDFYKRNPLFVVGIAGGEEEAITLVQTIIDEVYQNTGEFDVRAYIMKKQEGIS